MSISPFGLQSKASTQGIIMVKPSVEAASEAEENGMEQDANDKGENSVIEKAKSSRASLFMEDLNHFCEITSAHGLGRSAASRNIVFRIFWAVLFLAALGFVLSEVYSLFLSFQSRPTTTKVSLVYEKEIDFPVIVICNHNMIRYSKMYDALDDESWEKVFNGTEINVAALADSVRKLNNDKKKEIGHSLQKMILSCRLAGSIDCLNGLRVWIYAGHFLHNRNKLTRIQEYNFPEGVTLKIDLQQNEYIGNLTEEAGVRVFIGGKGQRASPYSEGFSLAPGKSYYIPIRKQIIERTDRWGNGSCRSTGLKEEEKRFLDTDVYSISTCRYGCLASTQEEMCNCTVDWLISDKKICSTKTEYECVDLIQLYFVEDVLPCLNCPVPCREVKYTHSFSYNSYPSEVKVTELLNNGKIVSRDEIEKNVLLATFFYDQMDVYTITESEPYKIETFMGDFGGLLGLWTGISVLTVVEFLCFVGTCCAHVILGRRIIH